MIDKRLEDLHGRQARIAKSTNAIPSRPPAPPPIQTTDEFYFIVGDNGVELIGKRALLRNGQWTVGTGSAYEVNARPAPGWTIEDFEEFVLADPNVVADERAVRLTHDGFFLGCSPAGEDCCPVPPQVRIDSSIVPGFNQVAYVPETLELEYPCPLTWDGDDWQLLDLHDPGGIHGFPAVTSTRSLIASIWNRTSTQSGILGSYDAFCQTLVLSYFHKDRGNVNTVDRNALTIWLNFQDPYIRVRSPAFVLLRGTGPPGNCELDLTVPTPGQFDTVRMAVTITNRGSPGTPIWDWLPLNGPSAVQVPLYEATPIQCNAMATSETYGVARLFAICNERPTLSLSEERQGEDDSVWRYYHTGCDWWSADPDCVRVHCRRGEPLQWWERPSEPRTPCDVGSR